MKRYRALEEKVFIPRQDSFEGLFGVFDDSLPDGWGRLLTERLLLKNGENPYEVDCLNRLSMAGDSGMGHYRIIRSMTWEKRERF